ncbi:hypothetical protein J3R30DRAFT_3708132 [Lentinula aciculospora]|uniref:Transmembrane protein n=1 Tax=Lentinula aciculospora TaxID=153920 RepID=A0A9W9A3Y2_9AGAR|nr:hypothetical protein J3R30DRAFT_3708132 [Lentinula aciculospora]
MLIASWTNLVLYTCEALLCAYFLFFSTHKIERGAITFALVALLVDTVGTVAVCCGTVVAFESVLPNEVELSKHWSTLLTVIATYLASVLEQSYFLKRYWTISRNRTTTSILALMIFSNAALAIIITTFFVVNPVSDTTLYLEEDTPLASAAIMATTDISLAIVTIWKLKSVRTSRNATQALLHKFCFYVGVYGCVTVLSTSMLLVLWLFNLDGYTFVFHILGRIYTLTAFVNVLLVSEWRAEVAKDPAAFRPRSRVSSRLTAIVGNTEPITQGLTISFESPKSSVPPHI